MNKRVMFIFKTTPLPNCNEMPGTSVSDLLDNETGDTLESFPDRIPGGIYHRIGRPVPAR